MISAASGLSMLVPAAALSFVLLRRYQRLTAPQPLTGRSRRRLIIRPLILGALALLILVAPHAPAAYLLALLGAAVGTGLAYWSAQHTRYEYGPDGKAVRYVPNVWIGGGVFALFALRLVWKLGPVLTSHVQAGAAAAVDGAGFPAAGFDPAQFAGSSPLTLGFFLVFAAYQIVYSLLIVRASMNHKVSAPAFSL